VLGGVFIVVVSIWLWLRVALTGKGMVLFAGSIFLFFMCLFWIAGCVLFWRKGEQLLKEARTPLMVFVVVAILLLIPSLA
jgi:hypothetical protein